MGYNNFKTSNMAREESSMTDLDRKNFLCKSALENGRSLSDVIEMWEWIQHEKDEEWNEFLKYSRLKSNSKKFEDVKTRLNNELDSYIGYYWNLEAKLGQLIDDIGISDEKKLCNVKALQTYMKMHCDQSCKTIYIDCEDGSIKPLRHICMNSEGNLILSTCDEDVLKYKVLHNGLDVDNSNKL